jgi:hypothetical protein
MPRNITRLVPILVAILSPATANAGDSPPRYRFKEGEKLGYVAEVATRIETSAHGQTNVARMTQLIDLTWEVGRVDADGKATFTQTVTRVRFRAETPRQTVEYDTSCGTAPEDPQARGIAARLDAVVGARISAAIDARGQVSNIRLVERSDGGTAARPEFFEGLGNPSSETGFRRLMGQLIPVLPETAPALAQSWSVRGDEPLADGKATTETRTTYEGPEQRDGRTAHKFALAVSRTTENKTGETVGTTTGSGTAYLDPAAGRLIESSLTHARELKVMAEGGDLTRKVTETITLRPACCQK